MPYPLLTDNTVHVLTDLHAGPEARVSRLTKITNDLAFHNLTKQPVVARVLNGDITTEDPEVGQNTPAYDQVAATFLKTLKETDPPAQVTLANVGDHDIYQGHRTIAAFRTALGLTSGDDMNTHFDCGDFGIIVLGDGQAAHVAVTQQSLDWLSATLASYARKPCLIFHHASLSGTFGSANSQDPRIPSNTDQNYTVKREGDVDDAYIRDLLGGVANAKAWVSGHNHPNPLTTPDTFTNVTAGKRQMAHINCGAAYGTAPTFEASDPIWSTFITFRPGRLELRVRDHLRAGWVAVNDRPVNIVSFD